MDGGMLFVRCESRADEVVRVGVVFRRASEVVVTCEQIPILKFCNHVIIQHLPRSMWLRGFSLVAFGLVAGPTPVT